MPPTHRDQPPPARVPGVFPMTTPRLLLLCLVAAGCATTSAEMLAQPGGSFGPTAGADFGLVRYEADGSSPPKAGAPMPS